MNYMRLPGICPRINEKMKVMELKLDSYLSCIMVVFGGTGDLTHRKLLPALYNIKQEGILPENFAVVSVGRQDKTHEGYREEIHKSIIKFSRFRIDDKKWDELSQRIYYAKLDFADTGGYTGLNYFLKGLDEKYNTYGNRVYYLAVAPENFETIVGNLHKNGMSEYPDAWRRVVIEKPFGRDMKSAQFLNQKITSVFSEKDTYRIDHYLGKEMLQNMMVIRFANAFFEPIWNNRYIDNIQISSSETVGVENMGDYYERTGVLRDMVQNHMLQLLTLTAMEPPVNLEPESIRDEKVKVLRSLQTFTPEMVRRDVVRGQYGAGSIKNMHVPGYREEKKVDPKSNTETFIAFKIHVENFRWSGVPFYIRTGKRMPVKSTEVVIQFKQLPEILFFKEFGMMDPNILVIKVQPQEGVFLSFNAKKPGTSMRILPVQMDFCQNCELENNSPEAYERLLYDVMRGDSTLFTRWDEVEYSWRFIDTIAEAWREEKPDFPNYPSGTWGPAKADELLKRDNRK